MKNLISIKGTEFKYLALVLLPILLLPVKDFARERFTNPLLDKESISIVKAKAVSRGKGLKERRFLVETMLKIADPLLTALSQNQLKAKMPVEALTKGREQYTYLEGFGRLLAGMAPWLELGPDNTKEGRLRAKYIRLARICLHNATDPKGPDFMNFNKGGQPVVDAAFLMQALIRAPKQLWNPLDEQTKKQLIDAFKSTRVITPYNSNWLLFSSLIEAGLAKFTGEYQMAPIEKAVSSHLKWYLGDGTYGDGPHYHWDYYNSYVIHPMFLETLGTLVSTGLPAFKDYKAIYEKELKRARRYAYVQASLISPRGSYPALGRSLAYRFGAFQLLSKVALMEALPNSMTPQEVRAALYTVIKRQISAKGSFDKNGWLRIGMVGHQPAIAENYISTGSLYLCSEAFLILGLPPENKLWQGPDVDWIGKRIWSGENLKVDHSIND